MRYPRLIGVPAIVLVGVLLTFADLLAAEEPLSLRIVGRDVAAAFPPLDDPEVRAAAEADHMRPDDVVVGLVRGDAARAYPWWVLKNYHAVNDVFAGVPVLIAFCEQCSGASAFHRRLGERLLSMETEGICGGSIILRDRQTGTLWAPFDGHSLEGPLHPRELERLPVFLTTWEDWQARHPTTDAVYDAPEQRSGHGEREHPGKWGIVGMMGETLTTWDTRLAENDFVYGVREGGLARAYPRRAVVSQGGIVADEVGGRPIVVVARGDFEMAAYDRRLTGTTHAFEPVDKGRFRDLGTGSVWSIEGIAVEGPLQGQRLEPVNGYQVEWHVWVDYHPDTEVFGLATYQPPSGFEWPIASLPRLSGEKVKVEPLPLDAAVNLVMIWARWCPPCREKVPLMKRLLANAAERGYGVLSIAVQLPDLAELSALKAFRYEHQLDGPIFLFDDPHYLELDRYYRAQGGRGLTIPTVFVVDGSGKVLRVLEGGEVDGVEAVVDELLPPP